MQLQQWENGSFIRCSGVLTVNRNLNWLYARGNRTWPLAERLVRSQIIDSYLKYGYWHIVRHNKKKLLQCHNVQQFEWTTNHFWLRVTTWQTSVGKINENSLLNQYFTTSLTCPTTCRCLRRRWQGVRLLSSPPSTPVPRSTLQVQSAQFLAPCTSCLLFVSHRNNVGFAEQTKIFVCSFYWNFIVANPPEVTFKHVQITLIQ